MMKQNDKINKKSNKKLNKSNRLKFKSVKHEVNDHEKDQRKGKIIDELDLNHSDSDNDETKYDTRSNTSPSPSKESLDLNFIEFGPSINGYRFIGNSSTSNYYNKSSFKPIIENKSTFDWSYCELPKFESKPDYLESKYGKEEKSDYDDLITYLKNWERIKSQGLNEIYFPLGDSNINKDQLLNFYKNFETNQMGKLLDFIKFERIKWHPDKISRILKPNNELKLKITRMFQIINEIYEELR
ncbi:hypothetical protein BN7_5639 [Wickerhamomyces ciferrii]|uniref:Uncharacterized protein n=1 Tax=Wickerhamomyces ciferrii (strain ATCC 14091 / BCRC 22168 / CBS 111 / JCM 3599 / NBRC 0793 / NRRL Y-1031 F-60-10) TaxID=1206466 RepID=K0KSA5_WICCF|nr:uncharacterized protein BN7_5639 [Wickerhamomyces ciferrii]CCH46051.1 hypothetical protein BN7_5639 [Wickerhamomyces ciferrii]